MTAAARAEVERTDVNSPPATLSRAHVRTVKSLVTALLTADGLSGYVERHQYRGGVPGFVALIAHGWHEDKSRPIDDPAGEAITQLYLRSVPIWQMAELLNLDPDTIDRHLTRSHRKGARTPEIIDRTLAGQPPSMIAKALGLSKQRVHLALARAQIEPVREHRRPLTARQRASALRMYREGMTYAAIAEQLDCGESTVGHICRDAWLAGNLPEYGDRGRKTETPE